MSFIWTFDPKFVAPYRSDDIQESCELAYDYFSMLVDNFVARLPEYRQPLEFVDWLALDLTLAEKVHLIFPNGYGELSEENHNPDVWPWIVALSDSLRDGNVMEYATVLCQTWKSRLEADPPITIDAQSLQVIFDFFSSYLQLFAVLANADSCNPDFKYPPEF